MVPVLNRPFLEHLVSYLKGHNIVDIMLAMGKSSDAIQSYFGDGSNFGVKIAYSVENSPLGTAGAVRNAQRFLDETFIVFNGDIFTSIDLTSMMTLHHERGARVSIALTPVDDPTAYGVVETNAEDKVKRFVEKPKHDEVTTNMINAGIYILEPEILDNIPSGAFFMFERDVFPPLLEKGQAIYGYPSQDYWIDIGTPEKYLRLNHDLLYRHVGNKSIKFEGEVFVHSSARIEGPAMIGEGCSIGQDSVVRGPVTLGARCQIGEGAMVEGALLWQDCKVGKKARLRNCLVASRCYIGAESEVLDGCILGDDVVIEKGNRLSKGIRIWPSKSIEPEAISF
jgi:Nucleoside-diphosphate-sugar pyrophosphorylase involved in lipopolysaccharide biosynthesis/translation initiation factor 2B, gamma/epsilon subunits (eIF-2Bgamma/eIF-2Bepsilon)